MKRIRRQIDILLGTLLALLGLPACEQRVAMYGVPQNYVHIGGTVTDEAGKGIPDIKVDVLGPKKEDLFSKTITQADGRYETKVDVFQYQYATGDTLYVATTDIDGEANGSFESDTVSVVIPEFVDDGSGWVWNANIADLKIKLKEK